MSLETWIPFALATLAFAFMLGPAVLYMSAQTPAYGHSAGLMAALGIHLDCYVHIAAASVGLATLLHHAPALYSLVRMAGALYMLWLGGRMIFPASVEEETEAPARHRRVLRDSIVVEILNPKTALFFLTFLPQFVDPQAAAPDWLQFLGLEGQRQHPCRVKRRDEPAAARTFPVRHRIADRKSGHGRGKAVR